MHSIIFFMCVKQTNCHTEELQQYFVLVVRGNMQTVDNNFLDRKADFTILCHMQQWFEQGKYSYM